MKRIDVEHLRDVIASQYDIDEDCYSEDVKRLMTMLEFDRITQEEFEELLENYYKNGIIGW